MSILLGITGSIGSGKTTFAHFLAEAEQSSAIYETWYVVGEIATAFNQALKAELEFETAKNDLELVNQALLWLPDAISDYAHFDLNWNQLAISRRDEVTNNVLYEKLWVYLKQVRSNPKILSQTITVANKEVYRPLLQWIGSYLVVKASPTIWYDEIFRRIKSREANTSLVIINGLRYESDAKVVKANGGKIVKVERGIKRLDQTDLTEAGQNKIKPDILIKNNAGLDDLEKKAFELLEELQKTTK